MVSNVNEDEHDYQSLYMAELGSIVNYGFEPVVDAVSEIPGSSEFEPVCVLSDVEEVYDSRQVDTWINHYSDYEWRGLNNHRSKTLGDMVLGVLDYWDLIEVQGSIHDRSKNVMTEFTLQEFDRNQAEQRFNELNLFYNELELNSGDYVSNALERL